MLMMVTSRRKRGGNYGDEEQTNYGYDYLHGHLGGAPGTDGFARTDKRGFQAALEKELLRLRDEEGVGTPKVGIYLHGFNNDWQASIDELFDLHGAMTKAAGYAPVLIGFSWPSSGKVRKYLADREEVRDSVPAFTRFLRDINDYIVDNERGCFSTTYCVAHSMGNYLLRKGMEYLSDHLGTPVGRAMFNETVLLAPDLSSADIELDGKGRYIAEFSRRVHVYYSKHDRALKASSAKRFGGNRLGRHGPNDYANLPSNVVAVDAKVHANSRSMDGILDRRGEQVSVHSSHRYHPKILSDVLEVLSSVSRDVIPGRQGLERADGRTDLPPNHYRLAE